MDLPEVYRRLQQHLDRMPIGFPATESGVEIRILRQLFTPNEAEIALELSAIPEPIAIIHRRLRPEMPLVELQESLERMASKGIIQTAGNAERRTYGKLHFAVGIYERQGSRLTEQFERDARQYFQEAFGEAFYAGKTVQLRTVPINASLRIERQVATHDDIRGSVETSTGPFAVTRCICRHGKDLVGEPCRRTSRRDNCLLFGRTAEGMVKEGDAQFVSREEMLRLLDAADAEGLVLQPENTRNPHYVCCCCGCCCGVLTMAKQFPEPAGRFNTNHYAEVDRHACQGCGECRARCQMGAIRVEGEQVFVDRSFCIGCGLCVTACPWDALRLAPTEKQSAPPENARDLYRKIFRERYGRWGAVSAWGRRFLGLKI